MGTSLKRDPEGFPGIGAGVDPGACLNLVLNISITQLTVLLQD
jgi:hypothetical protein